ncbi:MAG: DUF411 domain-containing protein [Nevskia sp.]|nr:DUF411 domain-containing protein [Nevskia sp.]
MLYSTRFFRIPPHRFLAALLLACLSGCAPKADPSKPTVEVWKSPTCQCCSKWIQHLRDNGFNVNIHGETDLDAVKARFGVPAALGSCHTAQVGGYVIEGHVPAEDIKRLLAEKPPVKGIAVPGMPVGSPGMEQGSEKEPYETLSFTQAGETAVYARH